MSSRAGNRMWDTVVPRNRRAEWRGRLGSRELRGQLRNDFEEVADQAIVGDLKNGRFGILVDRDDDLAVFHSCKMLNGSRDSDRDVQVGRNDLAGLTDLIIVGHISGVDGSA